MCVYIYIYIYIARDLTTAPRGSDFGGYFGG